MPEVNITQSGVTTAIKAYATAEEQSSSGNYRTIYLNVWAEPKDGYTSARDGDWTFNYTDAYGNSKSLSSPSNTVITSSMSIFSGTITVYVDPGATVAYTDISFTAVLHSPSAGDREISGSIESISGLSMAADSLIESAKDVYFGDACLITWTPSSASFYYKLTFSLGSNKHTTGVIAPRSITSYQYTGFSIPVEWAESIPNNTSAVVSVSLAQYENYSCTRAIGTPGSATFKATLNDSVIPVINSCSIQINNSSNEAVESWEIALTGYTRLVLDMTASGIYGSSIVSYNISGDYVTTLTLVDENGAATYTGAVISTSGNKRFNITCTDSRGRTSEIYQTDIVSVRPYTAPKITKFSITKDTNNTDYVDDDVMMLNCAWEYDKVEIETESGTEALNESFARLQYRVGIDGGWTDYDDVIPNGIPLPLNKISMDETVSYSFRLIVTDSIGRKSEKETFSSVKTVLLDFQAGGRGLGIGKICEIDNTEKDAGSMEVSMDSYFWGNIQLLGNAILVLGSNMFGTEDPEDRFSSPVPGQIYFKKVGN